MRQEGEERKRESKRKQEKGEQKKSLEDRMEVKRVWIFLEIWKLREVFFLDF